MLLCGHSSNPVITGSSVHNQRIERLWRDTFLCVLSLYYQLFYYFEDANILDPTSDIDLYCLHYLYVPKINNALQMFVEGWNNHAVTTEHSMTPACMFTTGTLMTGRGLTAPNDISSLAEVVDPATEHVNVPTTNCPLNPEQVDMLDRFTETSSCDDDNYDIMLYTNVRNFIYQHAQLT